MLSTFLSFPRRQKDEWANVLISRISSFIDNTATTWMIQISEKQTAAVIYFLKEGKITVQEISSHPRNRDKLLNCVVLLVHRKKNEVLLRRHEMSDVREAFFKYNNFLLPE